MSTTYYRKLWIKHYGPIPKDENNITYEIHHKDKNHANNDINNLQCISVQEHFNIHFDSGDLAACLLIARNINNVDKTIIAKQYQYKLLKEGKHNFQKNNAAFLPHVRKIHSDRMKNNKLGTKRKINDELRKKLAEGSKGNMNVRGKKWWNNGIKRKRSKESPGEGWKQGFQIN